MDTQSRAVKKDSIYWRLVMKQDEQQREANTLARQGFHQQAAECRARARLCETMLSWIDNGVELR